MVSEKPSRTMVKMFKSAGWQPLRTEGSHTFYACPCGKHRFSLTDGHKMISAGPARQSTEDPEGMRGEPMKTYDVTVAREGRWWMVSIPELDGLTQARRLSEVQLMAREWIALMTDVELVDIDARVTSVVIDGRDIWAERIALNELRATIEDATERFSALTRGMARDMVAHNVPVRDVGEVLDVSPQRVSQLVNG